MQGCIDALQANYPAVARLVGVEWFRAAAAVFARQCPPRRPSLIDYGDGFAEFLAAFPPAQSLPYLAGVARLERHWTAAHVAADAAPLPAQRLAALDPDSAADAALQLHPATRWCWFDGQPIYSLWQLNRSATEHHATPAWRGEGALVVRPYDTVTVIELSAGGCAFLDACTVHAPLATAALAAQHAEPGIDLAALAMQLVRAGAFADLNLTGAAP